MSSTIQQDAMKFVRRTVETYRRHVFNSNLMQFTDQELKMLQLWEEILRLVERP